MSYRVNQNHKYEFELFKDDVLIVTLRDITGADLEYIETLIEDYHGKNTYQVIELCNLLCPQTNFNQFPYRLVVDIYRHLLVNILKNCYMKKDDWYKMVYHICGGNLSNVLEFENVPISKLLNMYHTIVELCPNKEKN